jgi:hypothetical protein
MINSDFDLDLQFGQEGEELFRHILTGRETIEVKRDRQSSKTGNAVIEYKYKGRPSGLAITKANWWGFIFNDDTLVLIRTIKLKEIARKFYHLGKTVKGGDKKASDMILVPITELIAESLKGATHGDQKGLG